MKTIDVEKNNFLMALILVMAIFVGMANLAIVSQLYAEPASYTAFLTWEQGGGGEPDGYYIYRSEISGNYGDPIATVENTSYSDNTIEYGKTYYYTIIAFNDCGNSPRSNEDFKYVKEPSAPVLKSITITVNVTIN